MVRDPGASQPGSPEPPGGGDPGRGVVDVDRAFQPFGPREGAERLVTRLQHVSSPDAAALDAEREIGLEADRLAGAGRVRRVAAAVDEDPLRRGAAVVEGGLAHELDLDAALEALHGAHDHMLRVVVGRWPGVRRDLVLVVVRPHRQRIAHDDPAGGRLPRRLEHVRARLVDPGRGVVDPERADPEGASLAVEQAAEGAWRVERGHAEPVDPAVRRDEGPRVAVGQECVVGDGRERRRGRRALRLGLGGFRCGAHDAIQGSCQLPNPATSLSAALGPHEFGA